MELTYKKIGCTELTEAHIGTETTLAGWASTIRDLGGIIFVELMLKDLFKRLSERDLTIDVTDAAKDYLAKEGYSETYGARPLRRVIQKKVEDVLAEEILSGNYKANDKLLMDYRDEKIIIEKKVD